MSRKPKSELDGPPKTSRIKPGQRYGRLTVESFSHRALTPGGWRLFWNCRCECGRTVKTNSGVLRRGRDCNCGCVPRHKPSGVSLAVRKLFRRDPSAKSIEEICRRLRKYPKDRIVKAIYSLNSRGILLSDGDLLRLNDDFREHRYADE